MKSGSVLLTFLLIFAFYLGESEQSSFEDERCVCACPRSLCPNGTGPIFIKMIPPNDCVCELVVPQFQSSRDLCHFCSCKHEIRNTTTIKVVVIFIICVVTLLSIYMLFLMCLDPFIQQRQSSYAPIIDDDVTMDNMASLQRPRQTGESTAQGPAAAAGLVARGGALSRQTSLLSRVSSEQQKWKGTVEEQRRNIYHHHSMLN
ncbi:proton-transporting V-type ATPase complex assembly regulator TMEM9-like [Babylonia areolata]|uniref:proton-transporting V-type ATPase complex assembly regulator TMEM9-like n=1 Tax=Babylonia areolata TaxID=304850 RepID=UPI003FD33B65